MIKVIIFTILLVLCLTQARAQTVTVEQDFIDDAAKAFALVIAQRDEIESLKQQVKDVQKLAGELEKAQLTPCTIAQRQVKNDLETWLNRLSGEPVKDKEVLKILKDVRKQGRRAIAAQCGFSSQSDFMKALDISSRFLPLLLLLK